MVSMRHGNAVNLLTCHMAGYLNTKRDQGRADSRPDFNHNLSSAFHQIPGNGRSLCAKWLSVLLKVAAHLSGYGELLI